MKEPNLEWRERENKEGTYKARRLVHPSKTNIEYGERTWTTGQTVRDLMQNHLDAETERHYKELADMMIDTEKFVSFRKWYADDQDRIAAEDERLEAALFATFMFSKHVEDMGPEAREKSEVFLRESFFGIPLKKEVTSGGYLNCDRFLDAVHAIPEERPHVFYDVVDALEDRPLGMIPYETLRDEEKYKELIGEGREFRYKIVGMKVADQGSGYDSQLSSLYISSKGGKKYLRGKYGEGAKMSQLHSIRHGAKIKMRSRYKVRTEEGEEKERLWQVKPEAKKGEMVAHGVELEMGGSEATGSSMHLDLRGADEGFTQEMLENIDPRLGGLENNIVEFGEKRFEYPLPVAARTTLVGVNMNGIADEQFVQGLRVECDFQKSGYSEPWFSYDVLDPDIVSGRDRNELSWDFWGKVSTFWEGVRNEEMLTRLAELAVKGGGKRNLSTGPEFSFLDKALHGPIQKPYEGDEEYERRAAEEGKSTQIIDVSLLKALSIEEGGQYFVISEAGFSDKKNESIIAYAIRHGYKIRTVEAGFSGSAISAWAGRVAGEGYHVLSSDDVTRKMDDERRSREDTVVEGEAERTAREIFGRAVGSVNTFFGAVKLDTVSLEMSFVNGYEAEEANASGQAPIKNPNILPVRISLDKNSAVLNLAQLPDPLSDPVGFQRTVEIYLLSLRNADRYRFMRGEGSQDILSDEKDDDPNARMKMLKVSQHLLGKVLRDVIPEGSPTLANVPSSFAHHQSPGFSERLKRSFETWHRKRETGEGAEREKYDIFRRSLDLSLSSEEAKDLLARSHMQGYFTQAENLKNRVFLENGVLTYHNSNIYRWASEDLSQCEKITEWKGYPVYKLADGRFLVQAPFEEGAVLSKGEGHNREYVFNEGNDFLEMGKYAVNFLNIGSSLHQVKPQPCGMIISGSPKVLENNEEYIQRVLGEYSYFPAGASTEKEKSKEVTEGVVALTIPIEYGKDEWDQPVRVFQDIIQNHADAVARGGSIAEFYEVEHIGEPGRREWVTAAEVQPFDKVKGYAVSDDGEGYTPEDIATMGASSKKSPLYAGKYGEGQKMVAAACLRNGIDLEYSSTVEINREMRAWKASVEKIQREVVLDGQPVVKDFVAFNVAAGVPDIKKGSRTVIRLPENATEEAIAEWEKWMPLIDPWKRDDAGNRGMSRYVRQLRKEGRGREVKIGCITILLDEPGAVYENGLRINPDSEKEREFSFGYDVPEVVTTRERKSFDSRRLLQYVARAVSATTDVGLMEEILEKVAGEERFKDISLVSLSVYNRVSPIPMWRDVALRLWPDSLADYPRSLVIPKSWYKKDDQELLADMQKLKRDRFIEANMRHVPGDRTVVVPEADYAVFKKLLPTVEDFIEGLENEVIPISPELRETLSEIVAVCAREYVAAAEAAGSSHEGGSYDPLWFGRDPEKMGAWTDARKIMERETGVRIASVTADFNGQAVDGGVVLNEELLWHGATQKRQLVETTLHELLHLLSNESDYTENFVAGLYALAKHFMAQKSVKTL